MTKATYDKYVDLYRQYLAMPKVMPTDLLDTTAVYRIRNAYYTDYFAAVNATNGDVTPAKTGSDFVYTWKLSRNNDGSWNISTTNGMTTTLASDAADAHIHTSSSSSWNIDNGTADSGAPPTTLTHQQEVLGWYTNPSSWKNNVILQPKEWGGGKWLFEKQSATTAIQAVTARKEAVTDARTYNLQGMQVGQDYKGGVVSGNGHKEIRR